MKDIECLADLDGEPKKYKKKPVVVNAIELKEKVNIHTREGVLFGYPGDFVIEGIEGEVYPCGKDIFWKTYEENEGKP